MRFVYLKGFCRTEEDLKEGFFEFTLNSNYIAKKKLPNIEVKYLFIFINFIIKNIKFFFKK
jgi:hypothetical protein